jgi:hypothetical protein
VQRESPVLQSRELFHSYPRTPQAWRESQVPWPNHEPQGGYARFASAEFITPVCYSPWIWKNRSGVRPSIRIPFSRSGTTGIFCSGREPWWNRCSTLHRPDVGSFRSGSRSDDLRKPSRGRGTCVRSDSVQSAVWQVDTESLYQRRTRPPWLKCCGECWSDFGNSMHCMDRCFIAFRGLLLHSAAVSLRSQETSRQAVDRQDRLLTPLSPFQERDSRHDRACCPARQSHQTIARQLPSTQARPKTKNFYAPWIRAMNNFRQACGGGSMNSASQAGDATKDRQRFVICCTERPVYKYR